MAVTIIVTVVLPFVPVMATSGRSSQRPARSSSLTTGTPSSAATAKAVWSSGRPGVGTTSAAPDSSSRSAVASGAPANATPSSRGERPLLLGGAVVGGTHGDPSAPQRGHDGTAHHPEAHHNDRRPVVGPLIDGGRRHQSIAPVERKSA